MSVTLPGIKKTQTLQAKQVGDRVILTWDHPRDYYDHLSGTRLPLHRKFTYEVRRIGAAGYWTYAEEVARTQSNRIETRHWGVGTQYYTVRTVADDCVYAATPTEVELTAAHLPWNTTPVTRDETTQDGGWPGTLTDTVNNAGSLEIEAGATSGTYTSPEINLDTTALHRIGYIITPRFETTKKNILETGTTIADMTFPPTDVRAKKTTLELCPSADSVEAMERDAIDNSFCPASSWKIEFSIETSSGSPVWRDFEPGEYYGRYVQFRITLTREDSATDTIAIDGCTVDFSVAGTGGGGSKLPYIFASDHGAKADGVTDDAAAINAALQAAKPNGNLVFLDAAAGYLINAPIYIPNRTQLEGVSQFSTFLIAGPSFPSATPMVVLGERTNSIVFNCRVQKLGLRASNVAGSVCVFSEEAQEQSGAFLVDCNDYTDTGIYFAPAAGPIPGSSIVGAAHIKCFGSTSGSNAGVVFDGVAGQSFLRDATITHNGSGTHADAVRVIGSHTQIEDVHVEFHTDGISVEDASLVIIENCQGGPGNTNFVHIENDAGNHAVMISVTKGSSTRVLLDDLNSATYTDVAPLFVTGALQIAEVQVSAAAQTSAQIATIPDLGGFQRNFVLEGVGSLTFAQLPNPMDGLRLGGSTGTYIRSVGSTIATEPVLISVSQSGAANIARIPDLGAGSQTRDFLMSSAPSTQEARSLRLVDAEVKREGQTGDFVTLQSDDQTSAANATIPDLGGSDRLFFLTGTPVVGNLVFAESGASPSLVTLQNDDPITFGWNVKLGEPAAKGEADTVHVGYLEAGSDADRQTWTGFNQFAEIEVVNSGATAISGLTMAIEGGSGFGKLQMIAPDLGGSDYKILWPSVANHVTPMLLEEDQTVSGTLSIEQDLELDNDVDVSWGGTHGRTTIRGSESTDTISIRTDNTTRVEVSNTLVDVSVDLDMNDNEIQNPDLVDVGKMVWAAPGDATISSGVAARNGNWTQIIPESGTSDTLDRLTGVATREEILVWVKNPSDTITFTNFAGGGDGQFLLPGAANMVLTWYDGAVRFLKVDSTYLQYMGGLKG